MAMTKECFDMLREMGVTYNPELDKEAEEWLKEPITEWEAALYERWSSDSAPV